MTQNSRRSHTWWGAVVRIVEWLSHSTVVQEVPGSNPVAAEVLGSDGIICKYFPL